MNLQRILLLGASVVSTMGVALALPACGGGDGYSSPSAPSGGGTTPTVAATITLTANGASDTLVRVTVGSRVRFTNNDSRVHRINSTPHGPHTDCPPVNEVGQLQPGESRDSGALNESRGCGFHDHLNPDDQRFRGQILVGLSASDPIPTPDY